MNNILILFFCGVSVSVYSVFAQNVGTLPQTVARSISGANHNNGVVWPAKWSPGKFARAMTTSTMTTTSTAVTKAPKFPFYSTTTTIPTSTMTTRNPREQWKLRRKNNPNSRLKITVQPKKTKISKESESQSQEPEQEEVIINDQTNSKVFDLDEDSFEPAMPQIFDLQVNMPELPPETIPFFDNQREPPKTKLVKYLNRQKVANVKEQVVTEIPYDYTTRKTLKRVLVKKYLARKLSTTTTTTEPPPYDLETESSSIETETVDDNNDEKDKEKDKDKENTKLSRTGPTGIDPHHPAVQQLIQNQKINSHNSLPSVSVHRKEKKYRLVDETPRLPLDKTLVYVGMIFSWIFWIVVFSTYYTWGAKHPIGPTFHRRGPDTVKTRSLDDTYMRPVRMIMLAEETYSNFNLQSLDCQKKALCELADGNSVYSGISYLLKRLLDTAESLPSMDFVNYLKEYKDAIESPSNCTTDYSCPFSMGTVFEKWRDL